MTYADVPIDRDSINPAYKPRGWMRYALRGAAVYHLAWGALAIMMPATMLGWLGADGDGLALTLWQYIGLLVGLFGIGCGIASRNPTGHWLLLTIGLMGKIFTATGFALAFSAGAVPMAIGWTVLTNDLIWMVPLALILWESAHTAHAVDSAHSEPEADDPMNDLRTNTGKSLNELANANPQMIVFLRHAGCTFCRQTLADISLQRALIEATGCRLLFVHLGPEDAQATEVFRRYDVDDVPRISDPKCRLYRQFGLELGGFSQLFGLRVWLRGLIYGFVNGHGIGAIQGNSFQMPGVYLYHCGMILDGIRHELASDRTNYVDFARQIEQSPPAVSA
ncbi:hypothetical protein [Rosistilla oblonga]|uniref:hypothetical protein n=1 Tax=Rosistilla oblonga TaxID=2527990 RepID=UPI003A96C2B8